MSSTAIIILHFGDLKNTLRCLSSLDHLHDKDSIKAFIVDNGTGNITSQLIKHFRFRKELLINKSNLGYAGGNNVGIQKALKEKYDYVLVLNNDAIVDPVVVSELKKPLAKKENGISGCIITYDNKNNRIWFAGGELNTRLCITRHKFMNRHLSSVSVQEGKTDFISGAAIMIKREVFEKIGLFPEDYFLYWEDVDFCYKADQNGYSCYLVSKPLVKHSVSASTGKKGSNTLSPLRAYYYARNPFLFIVRNKLHVLTGICGQLFVRLPYFLLTVNSVTSIKRYIEGVKDGISFVIKSVQQ